MVLDDASPQASGFEEEGRAPPIDPNSPFARYYPLQVKPELFKRPSLLTMYACFGGPWFWERRVKVAIKKRIENHMKLVKRYPTQDELDAYVGYTSENVSRSRLGFSLGLMTGLSHAYYRIQKEVDLPKGVPFRRALWDYLQAARVSDPEAIQRLFTGSLVRIIGWTMLFHLCGITYATYQDTIAVLKDPRMARFRKELDELHIRGRFGRPKERAGAQMETQAEQPGESQTSADTYDTVSERKGLFGSWGRPVQDQADQSSKSHDFFDDASPTAPEYQREAWSSSASVDTSTPSENVWERIRQQNAVSSSRSSSTSTSNPSNPWTTINQNSSSSSSSSQQTQNRSSPDSASAYASEEQQRQREREQAQREFDRLLEEERRVSQEGSSSSNAEESGNNKGGWGGWRRW
ncbi:hypothetical protein VTN77DRAFT_259 [Rasamsonia byssochlamydoides]|uniref:uncharacterized protein n=1 Tax=Rasamsonia byssochlamydoides TaxID=89139 RepID=UPI0037444CEF